MAPKLKGSKKNSKTISQDVLNDSSVIKKFKKFKKFVEENTVDVGKDFTEEARKFIMEKLKENLLEERQLKSKRKSFSMKVFQLPKLPWTSREDA